MAKPVIKPRNAPKFNESFTQNKSTHTRTHRKVCVRVKPADLVVRIQAWKQMWLSKALSIRSIILNMLYVSV